MLNVIVSTVSSHRDIKSKKFNDMLWIWIRHSWLNKYALSEVPLLLTSNSISFFFSDRILHLAKACKKFNWNIAESFDMVNELKFVVGRCD